LDLAKGTIMQKTLMLVLLLISGAWLQALQYGSPEENKAPNPSGPTTIQGCLHYEEGQFWLLDGEGTKHRLVGSGKQLKPQTDHEVQLTGKPSSRTIDNTPPGGASSVIQQYVFEVKSVKRTADNCKPY
jgi:hypothetical protein